VQLRGDLGMPAVTKQSRESAVLADVLRAVRMRFIPFGICAGSEKQGGQNEVGGAPVQAAANYVTTMTVDGQNIDLINYWAHENLSAGDQLIFKLAKRDTQYYCLNHYNKETRDQSFSTVAKHWQLVPSVLRMGEQWDPSSEYDYRTHGYWRIAQLMQSRKTCCGSSMKPYYWNDDKANMGSGGSAQLLQVLFAPVFRDMTPTEYPVMCTRFTRCDKGYMKGTRSVTGGRSVIFDTVTRDMRLRYNVKSYILLETFNARIGKFEEEISQARADGLQSSDSDAFIRLLNEKT